MAFVEKYKGYDIHATDDDTVKPRKFTVKFEDPIYTTNEYESLGEGRRGIREFVKFYKNNKSGEGKNPE